MTTPPDDSFVARHRWPIMFASAIVAVVILVLAYRFTAPEPAQTTSASGQRLAESDVLQVGALPVT